ncbi:hypothetical protein O4G76_14840 [Limimaricola sp. G21655-S1]|uniref:hypothetical protein n=1 Tax=Limimaricola sp. G21655-S1 TaxID=3014768 RepID=UPI0022AE5E72|nr:hypothetical protein [Limimaricola sp. G21655-S1]MCZ4262120.1 hypothetical protein [Limimaricola sp. G21655-S1]
MQATNHSLPAACPKIVASMEISPPIRFRLRANEQTSSSRQDKDTTMPLKTTTAKAAKATKATKPTKAKANGSRKTRAEAKVPQTTYAKACKAAGRTAKELSQYYTDTEIAGGYVNKVLALFADQPFDTIVEPSAGEGAFSRHLGPNCIALDIDPKAPGIEKADFLKWTPAAPTGRCLVIGNPPFGDNLALKFINHATFGDVIAFILPKIFCKKTRQNKVDETLHLVHEEEVPANAFTHEGKTVDMPCVLQVWARGPKPRVEHTLPTTHPHFESCCQKEADLVIRRVGAHAGVLKPLGQDWSAHSNIFLRATGCSRDELIKRFARLAMAAQACNGAGGGSINMTEIVELYEEELAREAALAAPQTGLTMLDQPVPDLSGAIAAKDAPVETARTVEEMVAPALADPDAEGVTGAVDLDAQPAPRHVVLETATGAAASQQTVASFNAAAGTADIITLTAPRSFRKTSVHNQLDRHFHLVEDIDSIAKVTGADGHVRSLPCAIQTWERRPEPRPKHALATCHADFEFCGRAEADVAIQRVGNNAGRLKAPEEAGSAQSHLFLRAVGCSPAELWARLTAIDFDTVRHNTAAVPSVAKPEFVALYEATRGIAAAATAPGKRPVAPATGTGRTPAVRHPENATEGVTPPRSAARDVHAPDRPIKSDSISSSTGAPGQPADAGASAEHGPVLEPGACPP